jgi:hypothetical protein
VNRAYYTLPIAGALRLLGLPPDARNPLVIVNRSQADHVRVYFDHPTLPEPANGEMVCEVSPCWERGEDGRVVWKVNS